jgi:hypothetical protein
MKKLLLINFLIWIFLNANAQYQTDKVNEHSWVATSIKQLILENDGNSRRI